MKKKIFMVMVIVILTIMMVPPSLSFAQDPYSAWANIWGGGRYHYSSPPNVQVVTTLPGGGYVIGGQKIRIITINSAGQKVYDNWPAEILSQIIKSGTMLGIYYLQQK